MDPIITANAIINKHYSGGIFGMMDSIRTAEIAKDAVRYVYSEAPIVAYHVLSQMQKRGFASSDIVHVARGTLDGIEQGWLNKAATHPDGVSLLKILSSILKTNAPGNKNSPRAIKIQAALDSARKPEKTKEKEQGGIPFATFKPGQNIRISSPEVRRKLALVAQEYNKATGKTLTITDGDRTASEQAEQIYNQIVEGKLGLYTQKQAAQEIKDAFDAGRRARKSVAQIKQDITVVIGGQMTREVFISRHLRNRGADVRSRDMSRSDENAFRMAARNNGVEVLREGDHLHLQF